MSFITGSSGNLSGGMPSAAALFSIIATLTTFKMMIRTAINELIPASWRSFIESKFHYFFSRRNNDLTIIVDEFTGVCQNEVFDAAQTYLRTKINNDTSRFKVGKSVKQKNIHVSIEKGQQIVDTFEGGGFDVTWRYVTLEPQKKKDYAPEKHFFQVTFDKTRKDAILKEYLPFVLAKAKEIKHGEKVVKLYTTDCDGDDECDGKGVWGAINFDHPSTFDTLAMEPEAKKAIIDDLDRFLRKREYYKKVGKVWKRGYLLYGPPGTGKSSLIAAMANYLKFDVYDLELTSLYDNSELRRTLLSTSNQSILVIEDIDCNEEMHDRETRVIRDDYSRSKLTLSCLLNLIDGLWSSIGDERIIIFTTNHIDRLDPALLRPGRMDMHIHMSYCTNGGFRLLAKNYLGLGDDDHHELFDEIKGLIEEVQVSPAQLAEELMQSDNADVALQGVVGFLKQKKDEARQPKQTSKVEGKKDETKGVQRFDPCTRRARRYYGKRFPTKSSKGRGRRFY